MINSNYYKEISTKVELSNEEIKGYIIAYNLGDSLALNKIVESNLRVAVYYAKQYFKLIKNSKVFEIGDLIGVANIGIFDAVQSFDATKDVKFSYWASFHIKKQIFKFIMDNINQIKSPEHLMASDMKIKRKQNELMQRLGQEIGEDEIKSLGLFNSDQLDHYFSKAEVREIEDGYQIEDVNEDEGQDELITNLFTNLDKLNDNEKIVITKSFGIDCDPMTYEEIGKIWGVGKVRVGQIRRNALAKLNNNMNKNKE